MGWYPGPNSVKTRFTLRAKDKVASMKLFFRRPAEPGSKLETGSFEWSPPKHPERLSFVREEDVLLEEMRRDRRHLLNSEQLRGLGKTLGLSNDELDKLEQVRKAETKGATESAAAPIRKDTSARSRTITLKVLASELAEQHDLAKKRSEAFLASWTDYVVAHLKKGGRVKITGLGVLVVRTRASRIGGDATPKDKASKKIAFRASKNLEDAI